jgi:hypothetical protein
MAKKWLLNMGMALTGKGYLLMRWLYAAREQLNNQESSSILYFFSSQNMRIRYCKVKGNRQKQAENSKVSFLTIKLQSKWYIVHVK